MTQLITQELTIALAVANQNPYLFTEDFLKQSAIVPSDWNLAQEPIYNERAVLSFDNGFTLVAEPSRILFVEEMAARTIASIQAGEVVKRYVETMKNADYQAVGINFLSQLPQASGAAAAEFMQTRLLAPGSWLTYGKGKVGSKISFDYELEGRRLQLAINEAMVRVPERPDMPVVLFVGSFNYRDALVAATVKSSAIAQIVGNWQQDFNEYRSLVEERFLGGMSMSLPEVVVEAVAVVPERVEVVDAPELPQVLAFN